jgi:peptide/nickel transport system substrate-binding protein
MTAVIGAVALVAGLIAPVATAQGQKVLKFIPQADLRILDPITTTAYITRNHGYSRRWWTNTSSARIN